jgi:hypothetical protein
VADALNVGVDLRGIGIELQLVDKRFATAVRANVRAAVVEAGDPLLSRVRDAASWSTRIPGATRMATSFGVTRSGVTIRTSATQAPHARPLEMGNTNSYDDGEVNRRVAAGHAVSRRAAMSQLRSEGSAGRGLRHPVYGRGWSVMAARPYFFASTEAMTPEIEATFAAAISKAVREAGFR